MSGGDLRAVLSTYETVMGEDGYPSFRLRSGDDILAALAAADEPLTATVECVTCFGSGNDDGAGHELDGYGPCRACDGIGTVRILAATEDVVRARLREALPIRQPISNERVVDAIVAALFDGDDQLP